MRVTHTHTTACTYSLHHSPHSISIPAACQLTSGNRPATHSLHHSPHSISIPAACQLTSGQQVGHHVQACANSCLLWLHTLQKASAWQVSCVYDVCRGKPFKHN